MPKLGWVGRLSPAGFLPARERVSPTVIQNLDSRLAFPWWSRAEKSSRRRPLFLRSLTLIIKQVFTLFQEQATTWQLKPKFWNIASSSIVKCCCSLELHMRFVKVVAVVISTFFVLGWVAWWQGNAPQLG